MSAWVKVDPMRWFDVPAKPGVYVFYVGGEVSYVGQSANLRNRISQHNVRPGFARNTITPWGTFPDTVSVGLKIRVSRRFGDWAMWELRLIKRLRPLFNGTFVNKRRNEAMYA